MIRRLLILIACAAMLTSAPSAVAAVPPEEGLAGDVHVEARYVYGLVPCSEDTLAFLTSAGPGPGVPERAQFVLELSASQCGPRALSFEGNLEDDGSWRLGDGETIRGRLSPVDDSVGLWWLHLVASTCPPAVICEFPLGEVTYTGMLGGLYSTQ